MNKKRPFMDIPRMFTTITAVAGGIIGLLLGQALRWSEVQMFVITLIISIGLLMLTATIYRAVGRSGGRT